MRTSFSPWTTDPPTLGSNEVLWVANGGTVLDSSNSVQNRAWQKYPTSDRAVFAAPGREQHLHARPRRRWSPVGPVAAADRLGAVESTRRRRVRLDRSC